MRFLRCVAASGVAAGLTLTSGAGTAAAADDPVGPQPQTPLACDTDGVRVSDYMIDFDAPGRLGSGGATLTDIDAVCSGLVIRMSVGDHTGTELARGRATIPAGGGTVDVRWDAERTVPIADIEIVSVNVAEPGAPDENDDTEPDDDDSNGNGNGNDNDNDQQTGHGPADPDDSAGPDHSHDDGLPGTGSHALPLAALGAGLLGIGALAVAWARRHPTHPLRRGAPIRGPR